MDKLKFLLAVGVVASAAVVHAGHERSVVQQDCCEPTPVVQSVPQTRTITEMVPQQVERTRIKQVPRVIEEKHMVEKVRMVPEKYMEEVVTQRTVYDEVEETYMATECVPVQRTETVCVDCVEPAMQTRTTCTGADCWSHADLARYHGYEAVQEMDNHGLFHRLRARAAVKRLSRLREP